MSTEKTYQLKDKEAGFYDDETGLDVSRDQKVKIDTAKGAGTKTMQMIATGGLVEVGRESKVPDGAVKDESATKASKARSK